MQFIKNLYYLSVSAALVVTFMVILAALAQAEIPAPPSENGRITDGISADAEVGVLADADFDLLDPEVPAVLYRESPYLSWPFAPDDGCESLVNGAPLHDSERGKDCD